MVPILCWPTSLWPLVQAGLKPKFVDIDPETLNVTQLFNIKDKNQTYHVNQCPWYFGDLNKIRKIAKQKKIILIEDNCESLGQN